MSRTLCQVYNRVDLCDEVLILNLADYIGESTRRELEYAREHGKRVRWYQLPSAHALPDEIGEEQ